MGLGEAEQKSKFKFEFNPNICASVLAMMGLALLSGTRNGS
jgi:hypothetical protein